MNSLQINGETVLGRSGYAKFSSNNKEPLRIRKLLIRWSAHQKA